MNNFPKEIVDDQSIQRFQDNVERKFNQQSSTGVSSGCMSSLTTLISDGIYKIDHQLGREAVGFFLVSQANTDSLFAEMIENPDKDAPAEKTKTIFLKFSDKSLETDGFSPPADPSTFRVFIY